MADHNTKEILEKEINLENYSGKEEEKITMDEIEEKPIVENNNDYITEVPDYVLKNKSFERHKMLEEALLTPELIKIFDLICNEIRIKDKNLFSLPDYLLSSNTSHISKDSLKKNFNKMIGILSTKTVSLVKIIEKDNDDNPLVITLLEKKQFNLHLFHRFNDYLEKSYDLEAHYRQPILYNLANISEKLKISQTALNKLCIPIDIKDINPETLENISQDNHTGKAAIIINLDNADWGEAIIPIYLTNKFLEYLSTQLLKYLEDMSNEKVSGLIQKKLRENQIEQSDIKKYLNSPDPYNNSFGVIARIFYAIISQVYNKNFGTTNKKTKETQCYTIISLIICQFILNTKMMGRPDNLNSDSDNDTIAIRLLFSNRREIDGKTIRIPISMKNIESQFNDMHKKGKSPTFNPNTWIETFQNLNAEDDSLKKVLILRLGEIYYYVHRANIIPLFLGILYPEQKRISDIIQQMENESILLPKNETEWDNFIKSQVSKFFMMIYECLQSSLMIVRPPNFDGNQTQYWFSRFFLSPDEIKKYNLSQTELDITEEEKRKTLTNIINIFFDSQQTFKSISKVLDVPFEKFSSKKSHFFYVFINVIKQIFLKIIYKLGEHQKQEHISKSNKKLEKNIAKPLSLDDSNHKNENPTHENNKKNKDNSFAMLNKLEKKFPELKNTNKLKKMIEDEHDDWNLKIGDKRLDYKRAIDGIINTCIFRFDFKKIIEEDFENIYDKLVKNNQPLKKIKNQNALKKYIFYRIILEKHRQLKYQSGS